MSFISKITPLFLGVTLCSSCYEDTVTIPFEGINADNNAGIYNPGRGFRLETAVDLVEDKDFPTVKLDSLSKVYEVENVSLTQCYFYLTELVGKDLTEADIQVMQAYFDRMKTLGKKAVLRFAYEKDFVRRAPIGPTLDEVLTHVDQLKPFLEKNKDLIYVVQAGLIGAWGEWHSSIHGLENSEEAKIKILEKLLSVVPQDLKVQVRVPEYKNLLKDKPELYNRLSFHDDFIVIKPDRWDGDMHEGTPHFAQMVKESPYLPVDGELPWGFWSVGADPDSPSAGWVIEGLPTARRLFLQHYSSLSVIHNYKEQHQNNRFDENNPPEYSMVVWKNTLVPADSILKYKMPVSDNYFCDSKGRPVKRSMFDYIRDHLGYRIELQNLKMHGVWKPGASVSLDLTLINRGFATVFGNYDVAWVLIEKNTGKPIPFQQEVNPLDWQPYAPEDTTYTPLLHQVHSDLMLPVDLEKGKYWVGLWISDRSERLKYMPSYAIRCANDGVEWWKDAEGKYGINLLTEIVVE